MTLKSSKLKTILYGFTVVVRVGLGCMFIYSSLSKIRQPYDFLSDVYNYELVGPKLGMIVAMVLPWMELLAGICLVGGIFIGGALLMSVILGAMFSFVIGWALHRGLNISCGCFGSSNTAIIDYTTLIRALVIMFISGVVYLVAIFLPPLKEQPET